MSDLPLPHDQKTVMVVDDAPANLMLLTHALARDYRVVTARSGEEALALVEAGDLPDAVLLDVVMPGLDGYEVCRRFKALPATAEVPVIFLSARGDSQDEILGFEAGAVDYIVKPSPAVVVRARVRNQLALRHAQEQLASANRALQGEVVTLESGLQAFAAMGDALGKTGAQHTRRIQRYVELLATAVAAVGQHGHSAWADEAVRKKLVGSAALYDLGKLGLPEDLLLKPGMLTPEERARMQTHAEMGAQALQGVLDEAVSHLGTHMTADSGMRGPLAFLTLARDMALSHHEHWDGQGYPLGLSGEQIPASARLVGFADVYDALLSRRPHKAPWGREQVREHLLAQRGRQFDPVVVDAFVCVEAEMYQVWERQTDAVDRV